MQILAVSGSLRASSYNTALLQNAAKLNSPELTFKLFDALVDIPPFDPDINDRSLPASVTKLRHAIDQANAIIISTPEYAHGIPGVLKNALDWLVSCNEMILKPIAVMSVSTSGLGAYRAHSDLIKVLHAMNTSVIIDASLNVPFAKLKFNEKRELVDSETIQALKNALARITVYLKQNNN